LRRIWETFEWYWALAVYPVDSQRHSSNIPDKSDYDLSARALFSDFGFISPALFILARRRPVGAAAFGVGRGAGIGEVFTPQVARLSRFVL
jgi:hypothetical protein